MNDRTDRGAIGRDSAAGGADLREAIHTHEWSQTALGPRSAWPRSLASCVEVMMACPTRMLLFWGPEHVLLYNDQGRELLGDAHPGALGQPARAVFSQHWEKLGPLFAAVLAGGSVVTEHAQLLPLDRSARAHNRRFDYTLTPIPGEHDRVGGLLHVAVEAADQRMSEAALADNEARLRAIFETVIDAILTMDERGMIDSVNPAVTRMFGYTGDELVGQNVRVLMPDADRREHDGHLARYRHTGEPRIIGVGRELMGRCKNGTTFPIEVAVTELRVGGKRMFTGVMRDIADRKRAEQADRKRAEQAELDSKRRLELVSDNLPAMISYIDRDEVFVFNNAQYEEWFGLDRADVPGKTIREVLGDADYERRTPYIERVLNGETVRFENPTHHHRLGPRETELAYVPDVDVFGEVCGFYALIFDITERKQAERALKESEEKFRTAFQIAPIVLSVSSLADGRYLEVNDTFEQVMGYSREEVIGRSAIEIGMWTDPEVRLEPVEQMRVQGYLDNLEISPRAKNGERKVVLVSAKPITVDGRPYVLSSWVDITERRRAEQDLRRAHGLIEGVTQGTDDMIAALDPEFRFLFFNEALRREHEHLWGKAPVLGESMVGDMAAWPEELRKALEMWTRALSGESFIITEEFGPADDKRTYQLRFSPLKDAEGRLIGAAQIFRNVTKQVRTQQALRVANQQLQAVDRRKDDYLAMLGHELRNPLAAIWSATELLELRQTDDPQLQRATAVLQRQSNHMARLIDGLLEVSRIARGKIDLERHTFDLREVLEQTLDDRQAELDARGLELHRQLPTTPVWTLGDAVRLTQVFDNLVGNALKFSEAPGLISVTMVTMDGDPDWAVIRVRDTGVGIRPEMLSTIFEPFQQEVQPIARMAGGLGLGLALAKGLVELHQGTIEAFSDGLGTGASFEVRLPLTSAPAKVEQATPPAESRTGAEPRRILIVEDNPDAAQMLSDVLELLGHAPTAVDNGEAALHIIRAGAPDLVLCDLGLPGMSGYELARLIRADPSLGRLPLVALTGYGQDEDRQRTAAAGFDAHLVKPVDIATLEQTLREFHQE